MTSTEELGPAPAGPSSAASTPRLSSKEIADAVTAAGFNAKTAFDGFGKLVALLLDTVTLSAQMIARRRFPWNEALEQAWFLASVSLLPTLLIAIPIGLVLVLEVGGLAANIGAATMVGAVDSVGIVREVAPVVCGIVLAGAGGSAITADLGARTIRDEIAAMEVMAVDPVARLVAPRLLACVGVSILLNGVVAFAGIMSGYFAAVYVLHTSAGGFLDTFSAFAQAPDILESTLKAAVFGVIAATVASYQGINCKRGAAGVGEAVNRCVVLTGVVLFVANLILTEIFLVAVPPRVL